VCLWTVGPTLPHSLGSKRKLLVYREKRPRTNLIWKNKEVIECEQSGYADLLHFSLG
jgi:hypothetical protein